MAPRVNDAETFGLYPGDEGYETFSQDFPTSDEPVKDYTKADWEMGETGPFPVIKISEDVIDTTATEA
jgi:hypothetical protein